ncbi:MAG: DEAD/DEAH box helicase [Pseudanabaenaceae cyanobacterium]
MDNLFPFPLDPFQKEAIAVLEAGKSVVVCAPTGSGKTLIGEYAIHKALARGQRAFYTTPLKALSNQKLRDFRQEFGEQQVGLLTGDVTINRDAPILVMTTEIWRNMLYATFHDPETSSLQDVDFVILDECHYMNDRQRGTVWEESIIYCPPHIQLVALSATVANSQELTDWISKIHGETVLIKSEHRPVPLQFYFCSPKGFFPLLDSTHKKLNPKLRSEIRRVPPGRRDHSQEAPSISVVVSHLKQRQMLPAIYFIFSRRGCDAALKELGDLSLVNMVEANVIKAKIREFLAVNPDLVDSPQISALERGIAVHHAGILPVWKSLIEELFQKGLIKIVFATETLAAGINMPARTTVISALSKRTDHGHRSLMASEFLQMAGRAGRRGMDQVGYVVTLQTPYEGVGEAYRLAVAEPDPLISQFTPSYGMVTNLLQTHSLMEAKKLVECSFGQYLAGLRLAPQRENINDLERQLSQLKMELSQVDLTLVEEYEKLRERLREEKRLLKILTQQAEDARLHELWGYVPYLLTGTALTILNHKKEQIPAVLIAKLPSSGQFPMLVCLTKGNTWMSVHYKQVYAVGEVILSEDLEFPADLSRIGTVIKGTEATQEMADRIPIITPLLAPEVLQQSALVQSLEQRLKSHPVSQWGDRAQIFHKLDRVEQLQRQIAFQQEVLGDRQQRYWQEFLDLTEVLKAFACLTETSDRLVPTANGRVVAGLRGDNELWLALALLSGELDRLAPHHLAAVGSALVAEPIRPDTYCSLGISPTVEEVLESLRPLRRTLYQYQRRYDIDIPINLEYELVSLAEQWALGMEWKELCKQTNLDEGDIVRLFRRLIDFLSQIPVIAELSEPIKLTARQAIQLLDRSPVRDTTAEE